MNEQEKAALRTEGSCCVESMERVFSVYLQARDFHSAKHMCFQYRGALNLMESSFSGFQISSKASKGGNQTMKRAKKDRPKVAAFEQSCPGLAPRTIHENIISNSLENASPNPEKRG